MTNRNRTTEDQNQIASSLALLAMTEKGRNVYRCQRQIFNLDLKVKSCVESDCESLDEPAGQAATCGVCGEGRSWGINGGGEGVESGNVEEITEI